MVINAVMLLHLECANPIDSPRHGGCRANADWRRAPRPPAPSLSSPSSLGPRAGRPESPRGLGPAAGSREQLSGTRDSGISAPLPARRVRRSSSPAAPGTRLPPTSPPHRLLAPEEPPGSEVRPDPETPWRGRERRVAQRPGGARRTPTHVRWIVQHASVGSPPSSRPSGTLQAGRVFRSPFSACLEGRDPECIASPSPRVKKFGNGHRLPE